MNKTRKQSTSFESFENRRRFPRLNMNLSVTVNAQNRGKFRGVISDISPDGVQMRYDTSEAAKLMPGEQAGESELRSIRITLHFDLAYSKTVAHVKIDAQPVYLRSIDDDTMTCGMFFSEANLTENKKISDFLFYQLQVSYADMELKKNDLQGIVREPAAPIHQTVIQTTKQSGNSFSESLISDELEELVLQLDYPKEQLDPFHQRGRTKITCCSL